ncbi:hypothetical protein DZC78_01120 [Olleya aquimaris]|uniref:Uncharacterized protein n=1 Tax=Olleya sediminilitoris TaxID=2795739 RepID=A0ABS1WNP2_9FLAO|nr:MULTISPECIES: hypothetical protein [Olleya]AXO79038.1 hypothetical protein DZC78_01120 [Olleya aquimaris]MBL7560744.1 hypothetical protein [Olleya sediminilitoris]
METLVQPKTKQKIDLIDGKFTPSEASDIIKSILDAKINFHKIQRLSITEGNNIDPCEYDSSRINELINEQQIAKDFFAQARLQGKKLKMRSVIQIDIEE